MRILIIGGTGLTGPHIVRSLVAQGHELVLYHRGQTSAHLPSSVRTIRGDKSELSGHRLEFELFDLDVVVNMVALTREDAKLFVETFRGVARRSVVISSADVYLAYGRLHATEPGPLIEMPLAEDASLRRELSIGGERYDKVGVEEIVTSVPELPATVLRYPAIYGPHDQQYRFHDYIRRMYDKRPAIVLPESLAKWRWTHSYVEDAAHAASLAIAADVASGRVYNVGEAYVPTVQEHVLQLARGMDWQGAVVPVPDVAIPDTLRPERRLRELPNFRALPDYHQNYVLDSSRIRHELGFEEIVPTDEALRRTIRWQLENPPPPNVLGTLDYDAEDEVLSGL